MIEHIRCDLFESGADVIAHQVNCMGVMGAGLARQIRMNYPSAFQSYKEFCDNANCRRDEMLGGVILCKKPKDADWPFLYIANLFAQYGYGRYQKRYTDYKALKKCLITLAEIVKPLGYSVALPYKMGCGLGGGDWDNKVYPIICDTMSDIKTLICEKPISRG